MSGNMKNVIVVPDWRKINKAWSQKLHVADWDTREDRSGTIKNCKIVIQNKGLFYDYKIINESLLGVLKHIT